MTTRALDRVEEWDRRQFTDGYRGLQQLADGGFSGVVRADGLALFLTRGVAVAVRGGDIEEFENASGTIHRAPSPALPLLAVMQERSDEVRDRFYTEQTPISTVDETLSEGGFTGYIELSENVLSGDYYLVYHGGNSMGVAFIGQSERLVDGTEAFESATDEVGIYEVRPVDIHPVDIPDPEQREPETAGRGEATVGATPTAGADGMEAPTEPGDEETDVPAAEESESAEETGDATVAHTDTAVRTIPSVDPARTGRQSVDDTAAEAATDGATTAEQSPHDETAADTGAEPDTSTAQQDASSGETESEPDDDGTAAASAAIEQLEQRLDDLEAECQALRERLDEVQAERDELREQLAAIRNDR